MSGRRLLLVDDEAEFGVYVGRVAEELGFRVRLTTNGHDFMTAYEEFQPDYVVLDVVMPEMDGIELIQWLAARGSPAKVLVVTGYNPDYARTASLLGGMKGVNVIGIYSKPLRLAELRAALS